MRPYFLLPLTLTISAQEVPTTLKDQQFLAVTIYNRGDALVKDQREVMLPKGLVSLAFQEISAQIRPETAILSNLTSPKDFWIAEQNFDFDLLTPQKLLDKYVGEKIAVISTRPTHDGMGTIEFKEDATVLATNSGVVLQFADRIETSVPGRIIYPSVPVNLRARPTLVMSINSPIDRAQKLELSYLTSGLTWRADYVASLSSDEKSLDLSGWVTLTNNSGTTYPNAVLQLVAGDVNRVVAKRNMLEVADKAPMQMVAMASAPQMNEESLFEYHLYTLDRPTTLKDKQTKQVALLSASGVPIRKEYLLQGQSHYYSGSYGELGNKLKIGVFVGFENKESASLGKPLPAGTIRVYTKDSSGRSQFIGEDAIDHTPKNEDVRLKLGDAFDITARRKQTDYKRTDTSGKNRFIYESAYEVEIKNAKKEAVTVIVLEPVPGDWEIIEQTHPYTKETSGTAKFSVKVPAEGSATLKYRVRVRI
ncbi:MAG: DUF4139 domain-containing protein [Holophagaceae bacterium]|nr:DUF4139 domain-containing protein [Holophagaceae bacterium]